MSYTDVIETRGRYRAVIVLDDDPQVPDGDFFGTVIYLDDRGRATVVGHAFSVPADDHDLGRLWERYRDMGMVERYLRIFDGVRGFDCFETRDGRYVNVVTNNDLKVWGWDPGHPETWPADPADHNLNEWRAYAEGDVYVVTIQHLVHWTTIDGVDDRDTWENVDSVGGYYGREWAEEDARRMLDYYTAPYRLVGMDGTDHGIYDSHTDAVERAHALGLQAFTTEVVK